MRFRAIVGGISLFIMINGADILGYNADSMNTKILRIQVSEHEVLNSKIIDYSKRPAINSIKLQHLLLELAISERNYKRTVAQFDRITRYYQQANLSIELALTYIKKAHWLSTLQLYDEAMQAINLASQLQQINQDPILYNKLICCQIQLDCDRGNLIKIPDQLKQVKLKLTRYPQQELTKKYQLLKLQFSIVRLKSETAQVFENSNKTAEIVKKIDSLLLLNFWTYDEFQELWKYKIECLLTNDTLSAKSTLLHFISSYENQRIDLLQTFDYYLSKIYFKEQHFDSAYFHAQRAASLNSQSLAMLTGLKKLLQFIIELKELHQEFQEAYQDQIKLNQVNKVLQLQRQRIKQIQPLLSPRPTKRIVSKAEASYAKKYLYFGIFLSLFISIFYIFFVIAQHIKETEDAY